MNVEQAGRNQIPFGYTNYDANITDPTLQPPPGPHGPDLLNNNETHLLDNFWENPDDVDPNFLCLPNRYENDLGSIYGDNAFGWLYNGSSDFTNNVNGPLGGRSLAVSSTVLTSADHAISGNVGGPSETLSQSADVWESANSLHSNRTAMQHHRGPAVHHADLRMSHHILQIPNYSHAQPSAPLTTPLHLQNSCTHNDYYIYNPPQTSQGPSPMNTALSPGIRGPLSTWNNDVRRAPLRFGSDDNFANQAYSGVEMQAPDHQLTETVLYNLQHAGDGNSPVATRPSTAESGKRKRHQWSSEAEDADFSEDGDNTFEEKHKTPPKRRRRSNAKDEDEDVVEESNKTRGGKGKHTPSWSKKARPRISSLADSPGKSRKASQAGGKPGRENLSEEQKRNNHIQSEQKRRDLIKQGFEDITAFVPELRSGVHSKSGTLAAAAKFMKRLRDENGELKAHIESLDNG